MKIIDNIKEMQSYSEKLRKDGSSISFVPTMGALHNGHLKLIEEAKELGDITIVSIFVNPAQFGPGEDLNNYPRDFGKDSEKLNAMGVDILFFPKSNDMYPRDYKTYVEVEELQKPLCGQFRPGHFKGVATIVLKLFNIVKPHFAIFGEKDYQQLQIIKKMVIDLRLDITIVAHPLVREDDGLAMSSRNVYLDKDNRMRALSISRALIEIKDLFDCGINDSVKLCKRGREILNNSSIEDIDYLDIVDKDNLITKDTVISGDIVAVAVRLEGARLMDNIRL
jgi:pantoate--beta-alanine ligase